MEEPHLNSSRKKLERLFFQCTNPCNDREDVNLVKAFCDCVSQSPDGPIMAVRLLVCFISPPNLVLYFPLLSRLTRSSLPWSRRLWSLWQSWRPVSSPVGRISTPSWGNSDFSTNWSNWFHQNILEQQPLISSNRK